MLGVAGAGVAAEAAAATIIGGIVSPSVAEAPTRNGAFPFDFVGPLPQGATRMPPETMPGVTGVPTGLPRVGRFQREPNGIMVQWFFFDGAQMLPIDRAQSKCFQKDCIFRFDVFRNRFVKLGRRRMNPMNVRAFFRAGRRVDAAERICRKMFTEKRRQKSGTVRRKSRRKKK